MESELCKGPTQPTKASVKNVSKAKFFALTYRGLNGIVFERVNLRTFLVVSVTFVNSNLVYLRAFNGRLPKTMCCPICPNVRCANIVLAASTKKNKSSPERNLCEKVIRINYPDALRNIFSRNIETTYIDFQLVTD